MKRERVLWVQSRKLNGDDFICVDGEQTIPGSSLRDEEYRKLSKIAIEALKNKEPWVGALNGFYFIKGSLSERDEKNRRKSFMYLMKKEAGDKLFLKKQLCEDLAEIGFSLSRESEEVMEKFIREIFPPIGKNAWIVIVIIAILLGVFLLSK